MKRTIQIVVSPQGEIQIDAVGFHGPDCEQATRFLEQALGAVAKRSRKPEHNQRQYTRSQQRCGEG